MTRHSVLFIISGSIAATKALEAIRQLKSRGVEVNCILTKGGAEFVSAKQVSAITGNDTYQELFIGGDDETQMPHIKLSRQADLLVVAPASANIIAKMANGYADDLASTALLASNKKVLVAPAMNKEMWKHPATQRNIRQIKQDGAAVIAPGEGMLACGEVGPGRMAEPDIIIDAVFQELSATNWQPLKGFSALVTSGPTHEAIDPVRYIANRSSGKQGHAIAAALSRQGADVTLITGPTTQPDPSGVAVIHITSAEQMLSACNKALPVDVAVCAAAVGDWKAPAARRKIKKSGKAPTLKLLENTDILKHLATHKKRPSLVIGFAAETENLLKNAAAKRKSKGADWIVANEVSGSKGFDSDENEVTLVTGQGSEAWPLMPKPLVAEKLADKIAEALSAGKRKRKKS